MRDASRRHFTAEEKLTAVEAVRRGESRAAVGRRLGVPESTLRGWCRAEDRLRAVVGPRPKQGPAWPPDYVPPPDYPAPDLAPPPEYPADLPQQEPLALVKPASPVPTAADALHHGLLFLRWLESCSDPNVTAFQVLQFRKLLSNVQASVARNST